MGNNNPFGEGGGFFKGGGNGKSGGDNSHPDLGKAITEMLLGAFANGLNKGVNGNVDSEPVEEELQQPAFVGAGKDNADGGLLPIILVNEKTSIDKVIMVFVNVGDRKPELAMKYLRNFHLGFTAIIAKLTGSVAFVFVPVREGETRTEVIDI